MITEGMELMLIGMGVVFAFLILLVGLMHLSGRFFTRFSPLFTEPESSAPNQENPTPPSTEKQAVALAVAYRTQRGT